MERASGRAVWRPGLRTGAERSTGRGCDYADDSEDEGQRAAGGPGPRSWIRPGERSAHWSDDGALCTVARADMTCVEQTHGMCRYDRTDARLTLLRSINSNMPFGCEAFKLGYKRAGHVSCSACFEPNLRVSSIPLVTGLHRSSQQQSIEQRSTSSIIDWRRSLYPIHLINSSPLPDVQRGCDPRRSLSTSLMTTYLPVDPSDIKIPLESLVRKVDKILSSICCLHVKDERKTSYQVN